MRATKKDSIINLLILSAIVYLPFLPVLIHHEQLIGMIPIAVAFGAFLGACISNRVWLQLEVVDLKKLPRRQRRAIERKSGANKQMAKEWNHEFPIFKNVFHFFKK